MEFSEREMDTLAIALKDCIYSNLEQTKTEFEDLSETLEYSRFAYTRALERLELLKKISPTMFEVLSENLSDKERAGLKEAKRLRSVFGA